MKKILAIILLSLLISACSSDDSDETTEKGITQGGYDPGETEEENSQTSPGASPGLASALPCGGLDEEARNMLIKMAYDETIHYEAGFVRNNRNEIAAITSLILNRANSAAWILDANRAGIYPHSRFVRASMGGTESEILTSIRESNFELSDRIITILVAPGQFTPAESFPIWYTGEKSREPLYEEMVGDGFSHDDALEISNIYETYVCDVVENYRVNVENGADISGALRTFCYYAANYVDTPCQQAIRIESRHYENFHDCEESCDQQFGCYQFDATEPCTQAYTVYYECYYDFGNGEYNSCSLDLLNPGQSDGPRVSLYPNTDDALAINPFSQGAQEGSCDYNDNCAHDQVCGTIIEGDCDCICGSNIGKIMWGERCICTEVETIQPGYKILTYQGSGQGYRCYSYADIESFKDRVINSIEGEKYLQINNDPGMIGFMVQFMFDQGVNCPGDYRFPFPDLNNDGIVEYSPLE